MTVLGFFFLSLQLLSLVRPVYFAFTSVGPTRLLLVRSVYYIYSFSLIHFRLMCAALMFLLTNLY